MRWVTGWALAWAFALVGAPERGEAQSWFSAAWPYRLPLTIASSNVTSALTNFPVLVVLTDAGLAARARANAEDLLFTSSDGTNVLSHEIETYANASGALVAWVRIPTLSASANTTLYLYYGNATCSPQARATNVWDSNYVAVWHLGEDPTGAGLPLRDSTRYGHHGASLGGRHAGDRVVGKLGNAQRLDGLDDRISVASTNTLQPGANGSLELWFKRTTTGTWQGLLVKGNQDTEADHVFSLELDPSGAIYSSLSDGTNWSTATSTFTVTDTNTFHQVQYTWDGANGRLYYDGTLKSTRSQTIVPATNAAPVVVGQWGTVLDRFGGVVDEVRISRSARSTAWIATQYRNQNSPGTFVTAGTVGLNTNPRLQVVSVNGGATPTAGTTFTVQVRAVTATGSAFAVTNATTFSLGLGEGIGTLGGTLTGTIAAGTSTTTLSGVTYTKAESGVVLRVSVTGGDALVTGDSGSFAVAAGAVVGSQSTTAADLSSVEANGASAATVTVTLRDAYGNGVSGRTVDLHAFGGSSTITAVNAVTDATGAANFQVRNLAAQAVTYAAEDLTDAIGIVQTATVTFVETPWLNASWPYRKLVTIDHLRVAGSLTNFPVLVSVTDAQLAAGARTNGWDLVFTAGDGVTPLAHEVERYSSADGTLVAWVKVPLLSASADTRLFLYFGHPAIGDQQAATSVWDTGFRAVWHAGENAGTQLRDSTANANHGTFARSVHAPTRTASGPVGGAVSFDGTDDYLTIPASDSLDVTGTALTISGWYRVRDTGSDQSIFGKFYYPTLTYPWYQYGVEFNTETRFIDLYLGSDGQSLGPTSVAVTEDTWVQVAFTYDGAHVLGYVDGQLEASSVQTASLTSRSAPVQMGRDVQETQPFRGTFDELRVSAVARSADWIGTEHANQSAPGSFAAITAAESPSTPRLVITAVNGGVSPTAGVPFQVQVDAWTASGGVSPVAQDTLVVLSRAWGAGTLGGTVTGLIPAGGSSVTISGVTYTKAETGVLLRAVPVRGDALTPTDSAAFSVNPGAVSADRSMTTVSPSTVEANGVASAQVVVTLRDAYDNGVPGKSVGLSGAAGSSTVSPASGITDAAGQVSFRVRDAVAENVTYDATDLTDGIPLRDSVTVQFRETPWYNGSWTYRKLVTLDHALVPGSVTNFPVLVRVTDSDLAAHARTDAGDLVFTGADGVTRLPHEIESYTSAGGTLIAWVRVPAVTSDTDTLLFLYYGNSDGIDHQDRANVWDASYRAVWHGGEGSGTTLRDATVHTNHGTLAAAPGAPAWIGNGPIGGALTFDGADDSLTVPNSTSLDVTGTALTVSGWVRVEQDTGSDQAIFGKYYHPTLTYPYYQYGIEFSTSRQQLDLYLGSDGSLLGPYSVTPTLGSWAFVAFSYDGTNVVRYLDAQAEGSNPQTAPITSRTEALRMGRDNQGGQPFAGSLDELRVSSVARSATWLAVEYANQSAPGSFLSLTGEETQVNPRLAITAVNGGASPGAGVPFAVQIDARTSGGAATSVGQDTLVTVMLASGSGHLGGSLTGTIAAGTGTLVLAGVTYDQAESGVVLRVTATSGDALTAGDSAPFAVGAGPVSASRSTVAASPSNVEANAVAVGTVTVVLRDAYDHPVAGKTVGLVAVGGSPTISSPSGPSGVDGTVTFTVKDGVAEAVAFAATDTTDGVALTGTATVTFARSAWYSRSWLHRKGIVLSRAGLAESLTNFPVLVSVTDPDLEASVLASGNDLLFTAADGVTKLAHQVESYTDSTGTLVAWVSVPLLSASTDTGVFLYYGNSSSTNQASPSAVWDASYRGVWHFTTNSFLDSTTNSNNGTNSSTTATTGIIGDGRTLSGTNQYVSTTTRFTNPQNFTVEAWFKTSKASGKTLVGYESSRTGTGSSAWDRTLYVGTDGKVYFECWSGVADSAVSTATYTNNAWHQAVAVRDDTADMALLYVDGQLVGSVANSGAEVSNGYWRIGSYKPGTAAGVAGYFAGAIDEVRVSSTARSPAWIAAQYLNQSSPGTFLTWAAEEGLAASALRVTSVNGGASPTAGNPFTVVVESVDGSGTATPVATNTTIALGLRTGQGALAGTLTGMLGAGSSSVSFTGLTYTRAEGGVVLTASRTAGDSLSSADSASFTVVAGPASALVFAVQPGGAGAGAVLGQQPVVRTQDAYGNNSTSGLAAHATVVLALDSGAGPLLGSTTFDIGTAAGNGTVTATDLRVDARGTKRLAATAGGLTTGTSATFVVANAAPVVAAVTHDRPRDVPLKLPIQLLLDAVTDANGDDVGLRAVSASSSQGASIITNRTYLLYGVPPGGNVADEFSRTLDDGVAQTTGTVFVTPRADAAGTNYNLVARGIVGGQPSLTFVGVPGRLYHVQRSTNPAGLGGWSTLWITNAPPAGKFTFVDDAAPGGESQYRAIHQ